MKQMLLYCLLFIFYLLFIGIVLSAESGDVGTNGNATEGSDERQGTGMNPEEDDGDSIFAKTGSSLELIRQLWESVSTSQYQSKVQLVVTNYSKWLMTHVFSKVIKGQLSQLPNFIGPGLKEYALAWQDEYLSSTEGMLTWVINGTTVKYCMIYWRLENGQWHRRCPNRFGVGCFNSAVEAKVASWKIAQGAESAANNSALDGRLVWTYARNDAVSAIGCVNEFCIQGLFPPNVQSILRISLLPLSADQWQASDLISQHDIQLLANATEVTELNHELTCDRNMRVVKLILYIFAAFVLKIILLTCFLSRRMCPGKATRCTVKYLRCYKKYNWMYQCLLQTYDITVLAKNEEGEYVERELNGIAYYQIKALPYALYLIKSCEELFGAGELLLGQKGPVIRGGRLTQRAYYYKLLTLEQLQAAEESDTAGKDESVEASDPLVTKSQQSTTSSTVEDDSIQLTVLSS